MSAADSMAMAMPANSDEVTSYLIAMGWADDDLYYTPFPMPYIVGDKPYGSLSDAIVDIESQLMDSEAKARVDLMRLHASLPSWDDILATSPAEESTVPALTFSGTDTDSEGEGEGMDIDSGGEGEGMDIDHGSSGTGETGETGETGDTVTEDGEPLTGSFDSDNVDWQHPPVWDGVAIPLMEVEKIHEYLKNSVLANARWPVSCGMLVHGEPCGAVIKKGNFKSHLWGEKHLNVRRTCRRCGVSHRRDNFGSRHLGCKA